MVGVTKEEEEVWDRHTAADVDLMSKFNAILTSHKQKYVHMVERLNDTMMFHNESSQQFEDALKDLSKKLERIIS